MCVKDYIWNPVTCCCENSKNVGSIIDNPVITCNGIIDTKETVPTNFNERKVTCKTKKIMFYSPF